MYRFAAMSVIGFTCTVYGTVFGMLSLTEPFYLIPGQPLYALALLFLGLTFPIFGFHLLTEKVDD